jgi:site-specific DNA-methyltransferase (adenine-specific)
MHWNADGPDLVAAGDNLPILRSLPGSAFSVVYLDPPFNTGRARQMERVRGTRVSADRGEIGRIEPASGERLGFRGQGYRVTRERTLAYDDRFGDYWDFLEPRLEQAWRVLAPDGTLYLHLDYREVHYAKVLLDALFGPECFINEIIWAYDFGARTKRRWPPKHDNILVYAKHPDHYFFDAEAVDREPYMAPGLVTPEKAERGKLPTDVWWHTIVSPTGRERTGYPTQKPLGVLRRIVQASSRPGDWVLDPFAGSGTTGAAAAELGRRFMLIEVMRRRLAGAAPVFS